MWKQMMRMELKSFGCAPGEGPLMTSPSNTEPILSNLADLALVGMILFLWALSCQPHSMHKPLYPLMIDLVAALYQFLIYSSHTVAAFML